MALGTRFQRLKHHSKRFYFNKADMKSDFRYFLTNKRFQPISNCLQNSFYFEIWVVILSDQVDPYS
jgi:hypothetical protein